MIRLNYKYLLPLILTQSLVANTFWYEQPAGRPIPGWLDPRGRDAVNAQRPNGTERFQLYRGESNDGGKTWDYTRLTHDLTGDNPRPTVVRDSDFKESVLRLRGRYNTFRDYQTDVVGFFENLSSIPGFVQSLSKGLTPAKSISLSLRIIVPTSNPQKCYLCPGCTVSKIKGHEVT